MTERDTEIPPAAPTLPPPAAQANPETERILQAIRELSAQVSLAGGIANDAQGAVDELVSRVERVAKQLEEVSNKQALVSEQAESAIAMAMTAHQKIDRTYDQLHALCVHEGCPILGEEAEPQIEDSAAFGSDR